MDPTSAVIQSPILESIHTKCGEVFISNRGEFLFYCSFWFCNEQFKTFHQFATHLFEHHYSRLNIIELPQQQKQILLSNNIQSLQQPDENVVCLSDTSTDDEEESLNEPLNSQSQLINSNEFRGNVEPLNLQTQLMNSTEYKLNVEEETLINQVPQIEETIIEHTEEIDNKYVIEEEIVQSEYIKRPNESIQLISNDQIEKQIKNIKITKKINKKTIKKEKKNIETTNIKRKKYGKFLNNSLIQNQQDIIQRNIKNDIVNYREYSENDNDDDDNLECQICGKLFLNDTSLKSHMKRHENGNCKKKKKLKLQQYKIINKSNDIIQSSITNNNKKIKKKSKDNDKIYKCRYCDEKFKSKPYFTKHENNHINDNKIYKCDLCDRSYFSQSTLNTHRLIHTNNRIEFQCDICNKKLLTERYLEIHKMKHIIKMEKLMQCSYCHLKYSERYLPIHELIHTDGLKFKCNTCDRKFLTKGHRDTHEKKHTGTKEFMCDICQKSFFTKGNLQIHRKTHYKTNNLSPKIEN